MKKQSVKKCIVILVTVLLIIVISITIFQVQKNNHTSFSGDNYSGDVSGDETLEEDMLAMVNGNIELSEKETLGESIKVTVKLDNDENIYSVMLCPLYNGIGEIGEKIETTKKDNGVYEAEINFEELNLEEGYYQLKAVLQGYNGSEKEIISEDTVNYSKTGVSYAHAYQKEDGRTAVQITALDKGEVLVSTTNVVPTADDTRWTKYEAGKEYIIATPEENVENVYVWYKAGEQIINAADSGISVMSYADGLGVMRSIIEEKVGNYGKMSVFDNANYKREEILTITLSKTNNVPANLIEQWDISQNQDRSVWAYIVQNTEDNTKYDLYICGNGSLIAPQDSANLFYYYSNCKEIRGLENLDVSNVMDMLRMFQSCKGISDLTPIKDWQVGNVTSMSNMFSSCSGISDLTPIKDWQVGNVTSMASMFSSCSGISDLTPLKDWQVGNVTSMASMFSSCSGISDLTPLKDWQVDNVEKMSYMFNNCSGITDVRPLENWQVGNVTDMSNMFFYCSGISDLTPIKDWQVGNVTSMSNMFSSCSGISDLTPLKGWNVDSVTSMSNMFFLCSGISDLTPLKDWQVGNVTNMSTMFSSCSGISDLTPIKDWQVGNVTNMSNMFSSCSGISDLTPIKDWQVGNVTNMASMFSSCSGISDLTPLKDWQVDNVEKMSYMFNNCSGITDLRPLENWQVDNVEDMSNMFRSCSNLQCVSLINWNTAKVTDNCGMFNGCTNLKYLLLGNNFDKIQSVHNTHNDYFAGPTTSIITLREEPIQFLKYSSYEQYCPATLFVKNTDSNPSLESTFEAVDTENMFGPERIEEVISLIGENPLTVSLGTTYEDPGVNVGLYPGSDLVNYPDLKLTLETDASAVESALREGKAGEYAVTYTLKHDGVEFCRETRTVIIEKPAFIMEWTIPAGADGNDASGNPQTIIQLPIEPNTANNYTVDWGDGQKETFGSTANFPSHTYHNTTEQAYIIKITGQLYSFGYGTSYIGNSADKRPTKEKYSEYYPFTQYLTKIIAWGELGAKRYGFAFCKNLKEVASPTTETFKNVTSFEFAFEYCSELKGVPEDLFAEARKVVSFAYAFDSSGLSGKIPENLFANNVAVTSFTSTFQNCRGLNGEIPENLFANNLAVTNFNSTFYYSGISGKIPEKLFTNNQKVTNFTFVFGNCKELSGSIPEGLFANNPAVITFSNAFDQCSCLSGSIPRTLFANNPAVTTFDRTFYACSGLSGEIPETLFAKNPAVTNFSNTFSGCRGLTGMIPADLFANNPLASNFSNTFSNCPGLTAGEITLNSQKITNMENMFSGCSNLESLVFGSEFKDFTGVNMFAGCDNLRAIILLNDASSTDQVGTILEELNNSKTNFSDTDLGLPNRTKIYVANEVVEKVYEQVWSQVPADRICPLIEVKGPNPMEVGLGKPFEDTGYTVAGFETTEKEKYEQYGFYVVVEGVDGNLTATEGEKEVRYHLQNR